MRRLAPIALIAPIAIGVLTLPASGGKVQDLLEALDAHANGGADPEAADPAAPRGEAEQDSTQRTPSGRATAPPEEPPAGAASTESDSPNDFAAELLDAHNAIRASVGSPPLSWSIGLAASAQAWSNELASRGCALAHSPQRVGENLAGFWGRERSAREVVEAWGAERHCYNHMPIASQGECSDECSSCWHYTQIIWRSTLRLGCGVAHCPGDGQVWTCQYDPLGNLRGLLPY